MVAGIRKKPTTMLLYREMNIGKISIHRLFNDEIWTTELTVAKNRLIEHWSSYTKVTPKLRCISKEIFITVHAIFPLFIFCAQL